MSSSASKITFRRLTAAEKIRNMYIKNLRPKPPSHLLLSDNEVSESRKLFTYFDRNKDGHLDPKEYNDLVTYETTNRLAGSNLKDVFNSIDINKDGHISFPEMLEFKSRPLKKLPLVHDLEALFMNYDKNGDGRVNLDEMRLCWLQLGEDPIEPNFRRWFVASDSDKDGLIDVFEFIKFVQDNAGKQKRT